MLKEMRAHSKSVIIWVLFGILIAVFVIGFGTPGTEQLSCGSTTKIGEVAGRDIHREDFKYAVRFMMREGSRPVEKAVALDLLIRREILAQEALKAGFRTAVKPDDAGDDPDVANMLAKRRLIVLGNDLDLFQVGGWPSARTSRGKFMPAKHFNYDHFKKWSLWRFGLTVQQFMRQQQRELLAKQMMDTIRAGVQISEEEAKAYFEYQNHTLTLQVARFDVAEYRKGLDAGARKIQDFLKDKANAAKVEKLYDDRYKGKKDFPDQRYLRHIVFKWEADAEEIKKRAVRFKLVQLRRRLNKNNFAREARKSSQDKRTGKTGGLLGWNAREDLKYDKKFAEAVFKMKDGEISKPLETKDGYHLVLVQARRKDAWPLKQAQPFLAEELLLKQKAVVRTRRVAQGCMDKLRAGKSMEEVFASGDDTEPSDEKDNKKGDKKSAKAKTPSKKKESESKDPLPKVQEVIVSRVDKRVQGLEELKDLVPKAWTLTKEQRLMDKLLELRHDNRLVGLAIVRFKSVTLPDMQEFEAQKTSLMDQYLKTKQHDALNRWVRYRCEKLASKGKIRIAGRYTKIVDSPKGPKGATAKPVTFKYTYCKLLPRHATEAFWR